jgi:copper chaperone
VPGVQEAKVHFNTGRIEVEHDPQQAGEDRLVSAVKSAGYEARIAPF